MRLHVCLHSGANLLLCTESAPRLSILKEAFLDGNWYVHSFLCVRTERSCKFGDKPGELPRHATCTSTVIAHRHLCRDWTRPCPSADPQANLQLWSEWPRCAYEPDVQLLSTFISWLLCQRRVRGQRCQKARSRA